MQSIKTYLCGVTAMAAFKTSSHQPSGRVSDPANESIMRALCANKLFNVCKSIRNISDDKNSDMPIVFLIK